MTPAPEISIVIPLYNAERYIGDCLDSILAQTFRDCEVIVVDDCSTDSSAAIVESYIPRFGGRLILTRTSKNSGGCSVPRNKGLAFARGEYVFFMDADDLLTNTALAEMHALIENFDTDAIYFERHYEANNDLSDTRIRVRHAGAVADRPTFEPEGMENRVQAILNARFGVTVWIKLVKRTVLAENEIISPLVDVSEDELWTAAVILFARRILRVPNAVYVQRKSDESFTRKERTNLQSVTFRLSGLIFGLKALDEMICKHEFFRQNPQQRYAVLDWFVSSRYGYLPFIEQSSQLPPFEICAALREKFGNRLGDFDVLIPALCTALNTQVVTNYMNGKYLKEFAERSQKRIAELEAALKAAEQLSRRDVATTPT